MDEDTEFGIGEPLHFWGDFNRLDLMLCMILAGWQDQRY
jgi:hypothetical protein